MFGEPTRGRAIGKTSTFHGIAGCRLDRQTIDDRLELLAMADDGSALRTIFTRLMVLDPQSLGTGPALDQVDCAAQNETAVDHDGFALAARVASGRIRQAKGKLKK